MLSEDAVRAQRDKMKIVYTPIHGSGYMPVTTMLERMGMPVVTVPEQVNPDPDFSTVRVPNPEEADALSMAVALAKRSTPPLLSAPIPTATEWALRYETTRASSSF